MPEVEVNSGTDQSTVAKIASPCWLARGLPEHDRVRLNRLGIPIARIPIQDATWTEVSIYGPGIFTESS